MKLCLQQYQASLRWPEKAVATMTGADGGKCVYGKTESQQTESWTECRKHKEAKSSSVVGDGGMQGKATSQQTESPAGGGARPAFYAATRSRANVERLRKGEGSLHYGSLARELF